MKMLGISIDALTREDVLTRVEDFLEEPRFHRIATVNPEFLLQAEKDAVFRQALLDADLRIADGIGIIFAGLLHGKCISRFPGVDLMEEILRIADQKKLSVHLAVRADGLSKYEEVKAEIFRKYPNIEITGADIEALSDHSPSIVYPASIIFCNFGAPEQETFLNSLRDQNNIRLTMGVGGSFDYLTGKQKRAPKWLRTIGFEWIWRFILQPKRFRRIWNAAIIFPLRILQNKKGRQKE